MVEVEVEVSASPAAQVAQVGVVVAQLFLQELAAQATLPAPRQAKVPTEAMDLALILPTLLTAVGVGVEARTENKEVQVLALALQVGVVVAQYLRSGAQ
jgi:hypothetical protein